MRRLFGDALMSFAALLLLFTVLLAVDGRVRERVSGVWAPDSSQLAGAGQQVGSVVSIAYEVARDYGMEHASMTIFALAATVLVVFMLRT
jgi:hypothetical protein